MYAVAVAAVVFVVAELRRPEGSSGGAPYPYRKEKETHEFIFLHMVIMASGIARGRIRTTTVATESRKMRQRHVPLVYSVLL